MAHGACWRRRSKTSLGILPGPAAGLAAGRAACGPTISRERAKKRAFYERQDTRNAEALARDPNFEVKVRPYTGAPTFLDQILTSLETVFAGFLFATLIAVPLGIMCGLSQTVNAAINPLVQIFKPVSPLAWLPIVTMVVSAVYVSRRPAVSKIVSGLGDHGDAVFAVADADQHRARRCLDRQGPASTSAGCCGCLGTTKVIKLVLPSSLPLIFTGLRLSLGVGWMVLIAAEMLAQNPGLGKFVWDEFQNGRRPIAGARSWSRCSPSASSASCSTAS